MSQDMEKPVESVEAVAESVASVEKPVEAVAESVASVEKPVEAVDESVASVEKPVEAVVESVASVEKPVVDDYTVIDPAPADDEAQPRTSKRSAS